MKKIIVYIIIYLFFLSIPDFYGQNCSWRSYIDVPTSTFSKGFFFTLNGSYTVGGEAQEKFDANGSIEYGIAGFVAGLKAYTEESFCLDLAYQFVEQGNILPSFSIGVENITYNKYVAPVDTVGVVDFLYTPRPWELASAYLVATKDFGGIFEMTFGLGRGRFVGYGPRSQFLNFDAFFDDKHPDFVVGAFGGMKFTTPIGLSLIVETDGRDANAGFRYEAGIWKGTLSIDKMEHFFAQREEQINSPRVSLSLSVNPGGGGTAEELARGGILKLSLKDQGSGKNISGKAIVSKGDVERTYEILATQKAVLELQPGVYKVSVFSAGYKMKTAEVSVKSGGELDFEIKLSQVINPAIKQSMDLTKEAASDYQKGLFKEAREKLENAIGLYPNNEKAKQGLALVRKAMAADIAALEARARALERSGDIRGAIALWEQVLSLRGTEGSSEIASHIQSLRSRLAGGGKKPVVTTTTPTVAKKPPTAEKKPSLSKQQITDLYTKGLSAYFDGNYKEAIKYFEQVLRADPNHVNAKRYLGEAKKH